MKKQLQFFLAAVMFYTRIPVPRNMRHDTAQLNAATKYLPLIGWVVGGAAALALFVFSKVLPWPVAVLLSMALSLWITGAFHEDGFADFCDGFGGGWTKEKILDIMKDSRIGTYGMAGLLLVLLLKFCCLSQLSPVPALVALCVAHPLSRFVAVTVIYTDTYVRANEDAKAKPVSKGITAGGLAVAACFAFLPLAVCLYWWYSMHLLLLTGVLLVVLVLARWYMVRLMRRWIGGYTGDCLGAVQQVAEIMIYLVLSVQLWPLF
ncbi:adenosylcobinamide-GDP ribazoletransferase [Chitinophaga parva]|uniref:Adenosylcobinamide-GDP ribazoletransferase n=1 Tax=Chitinophaga parva TaxID=2169414 RepID=A0A2T7BKE1_9BACT|nr:adenosylcobinamide-GDP ribazoletransferase [Chitinophaga parva]PUZ28110.1 adenosylcobinamide-GDP ribazoletransferase [Chitinophaga parva]